MGDTQVGGNLSVHWLVNADDVDPAGRRNVYWKQESARSKGRGSASTVLITTAKSGGCGDNFTVRIKLPEDADRFIASVLRGLAAREGQGSSRIRVAIEKAPTPHTQIQVAWAGGQKNATAPPWSDGLSQTDGRARVRYGVGREDPPKKKTSRSSKKAT